jgi:hypothetical protein
VYPGSRRKEIGANSTETLDLKGDTNQDQAIAGPGPSTMASRQVSPTPYPTTNPPTDIDDTAPLQELDKLADELEELLGRDDILEITDEMTESTVITQILERAQAGQNPRGEHPVDRLEEEEWIEVDNLLDGDIHQPPIRPISLEDATDHPRLQLVLRNITKRIRTRRRTFRRARHEDEQDEMGPIVPPSTPHHSPESLASPKSSPSKRSSPFKVLVQAKSAVARRLRFRSSPPTESSPKDSDIDMKTSEHEVSPHSNEPDTSADTTSSLNADRTIENEAELPKDELPALLFPHDSLIANIHRFMRYSSAAYGVSLPPSTDCFRCQC